ncbi:alpha-glucosidase [Flavobacteriaceae bacterium MAR_2009_75]|nr:alpha-glucosidase [Flavobacteriaceae bacterium MAR_2009_75]
MICFIIMAKTYNYMNHIYKFFLTWVVYSIYITISFSCTRIEAQQIASPNGENELQILPDFFNGENNGVVFKIRYNGHEVLLPSKLQVTTDRDFFDGDWFVLKADSSQIRNNWTTRFGALSKVPDNYNQLKVHLKKGKGLINFIVRAYDEGIAFAYEFPEQSAAKKLALEEKIHFNFSKNHMIWSTPKREPGVLTAQGEYKKIPLTNIESGIERPLLIEINDSTKIALAEAKLIDYARLSFAKGITSKYSITASLDERIVEEKQDTITGAIIAQTNGVKFKVHKSLPFQSPWRVVMMGKNEGELLEQNYIIKNLNDPSKIEDDSWVVPGKALREVTLTTEGGLAAIDFVAKHNMQYVLFDAGWYGNEMKNESDATTITLDPKRSKGPFDIETITGYAKEKGVGVILYVNRRALEKQLEDLLPLYKKWGVAGIKYGFVRVGNQEATAWLHTAIKKAADYGFVVDVHDEYRPTGFSRTYPNLLTQEGIAGDEESPTNEHTLISMFTRMLAGAADNTVCYYNERVDKMGSHASQLAKTVCLFSPLQMLYWYDKPPTGPIKNDGLWGDTKHIGNEPELEFFDAVPTTWDETRILHAKIGEVGVIARRKGKEWFIGGINGKIEKQLDLNFDFLQEDVVYNAKLYTDDETINTRTKVKIKELELNQLDEIELKIKANNGFTMHLIPKK